MELMQEVQALSSGASDLMGDPILAFMSPQSQERGTGLALRKLSPDPAFQSYVEDTGLRKVQPDGGDRAPARSCRSSSGLLGSIKVLGRHRTV